MRVLVTGGTGLLGRTLLRVLAQSRPDWTVVAPTHADMDMTDAHAVERVVRAFEPNVIVHCAAMTVVDRCETEAQTARRVNVEGTRHVARAAQYVGARLIALSTDYVFDGKKEGAYEENDPATGSTGVYGTTKREAESIVLATVSRAVIVRIAWLYGKGGPDFVHAIARAARSRPEGLRVVNDQTGSPTSTTTVARGLVALIEREDVEGILHLTTQGVVTRYGWAKAIVKRLGLCVPVTPCSSSDYGAPAPRPANSHLSTARWYRLGLPALPTWEADLAAFVADGGVDETL